MENFCEVYPLFFLIEIEETYSQLMNSSIFHRYWTSKSTWIPRMDTTRASIAEYILLLTKLNLIIIFRFIYLFILPLFLSLCFGCHVQAGYNLEFSSKLGINSTYTIFITRNPVNSVYFTIHFCQKFFKALYIGCLKTQTINLVSILTTSGEINY